MNTCGRCHQRVADPETCWYCNAGLCVSCWDGVGHCGHDEADRINEASRMLNHEGRRSLFHTFLNGRN